MIRDQNVFLRNLTAPAGEALSHIPESDFVKLTVGLS